MTAVAAGCIDPKDKSRFDPLRPVLFSAAHGSGLEARRFVAKANDEEKAKGHLFGCPITVSPPVYPASYSPTGAVFKKNRMGELDLEVRRPTSDFSWPAHGLWMEWLSESVNDSVDLQEDFPSVKWMAFQDFANQAAALKALGEPLV